MDLRRWFWLPLLFPTLLGCDADDTTAESADAAPPTDGHVGLVDGGTGSSAAFTVGGTVSGLTGKNLVLTNDGEDIRVTQDGSFTFEKPMAAGAAYAVTVKANPTAPVQTCTVANGAGTVGAAVSNIAVTCTTNTFTVGGTVSGLGGSGLVLQSNGGDDLAVTKDGTFTFAKPIAGLATFIITVKTQPSGPSQTCKLTGASGIVGAAPVTTVVVNCANNSVTVGGTVSGLDASVVLQNNAGNDVTVTSNGNFAFPTPVTSGQPYAVTVKTQPGAPKQTCAVTNASGTIANASITNVLVTCTTDRFTVGGSVTGLGGTGTGVLLTINAGETLSVGASGSFTFPTSLESGAPYLVAVKTQPDGPTQTCTVGNDRGLVGASNIANITVSCATNTFTVGGTVAGLAGAGLVLQDNAGDDLPVALDGKFVFAAGIASGAGYDVTVKTQPSNPTQSCKVSSGKATVGSADITTILVNCATNTYSLGGNITGLGGTLTVSNGATETFTFGASGTFALPRSFASGETYDLTVKANPIVPSQSCKIVNGSGKVVSLDVADVAINCATDSFSVGGAVAGLAGSGLVLQNNGGDDIAIAKNANYAFPTKQLSGSSYNITVKTQPTQLTQHCTVANASGTVGSGKVASVNISCTTTPFSIRGTVSGLLGSGLVLQNGGETLPVGGDGKFVFLVQILSGQDYEVGVAAQPSGPAQTCKVTGGKGTVDSGDVTSVVVNCATNTYAIGGKVTGLAGTVVLRNNGGDALTLTGDGDFSFSTPIAAGGSYAVTVLTSPSSPISQTCSVDTGTESGPVTSTDITSVRVTCTTNKFTISANVTGLTGTGLVIQNNNGNDIAISENGTFAFPSLDSGAGYDVAVSTQPAGDSCRVVAGSGVVANANVVIHVKCGTAVGVMAGGFFDDTLRAYLATAPMVTSVTKVTSCAAAELAKYDVLVLYGNMGCFDAAAFNTFVSNGGGIVATPWIHNNNGGLASLPVTQTARKTTFSTPLDVTVTDATDVLLGGVTFNNGDPVGYEGAAFSLKPGATSSVTWHDDPALPAVTRWTYGGGRAVYLDFHYITSDCALASKTTWGNKLAGNAVLWAGGRL
jgi:large repetitive protein